MTGTLGDDLLARVRDRLADETGELTPARVAAALRAESGGVLGDSDLLAALRHLQTELTGAGPLEDLLADPAVTDVLVTAPDRVWVDRGNGLHLTRVTFPDEAAVRRLAQRLALFAGRRLDDAQMWVDGRLPGHGEFGVRLHAVLSPVAQAGTCLSLRVLRPATQGLEALRDRGAVSEAAYRLLLRIVRARLAFLVVGGTGAGKTTMLAALLGAVDPTERIVCVEDAAELVPAHPHVVRLVARAPNVEGVGEVTVRDLVRQALRMRPDRIVIGEVRGAEVVDLLTALNTGHDGGAGTVHANSPDEVPARLEALAALGGLDRAALHSQLVAAVQVVLHVHRSTDGVRRLVGIGVVERDPVAGVVVTPAWTHERGDEHGTDILERILQRREMP
ncbi:pilus assembly protein CpaF [Rhodococcus rhodochrous J3]|uniref:TadA family conjugal transfer-associated ATPase n=2 Tax=Rhodococcus rhodochrous TaxID=1829 RepID=A0AA46WW73_RHORH|nr:MULTISPECIES: TadA family conjugal transfer-associated ATPase [Rhodococcus]MBF4478594.1 TadA family conjugal transfer-associated ATPase [Rhodococcus rhodochrous]MCD2099022.1 TadA family conjugal transfer-associated ATPase [Rhodococcus rhodochrous]MCD2123392.1 TadA family conjugal transfer-associated ATPase [Rhodococcus rhodochrous]MCQ4135193.1 TadA family conjugal transfer-associated ATPase [Rhodococcus rhodochrous]MDC3728231.1 TadA family conjugal transfer-associated ATPase [Rhodococcus sp